MTTKSGINQAQHTYIYTHRVSCEKLEMAWKEGDFPSMAGFQATFGK